MPFKKGQSGNPGGRPKVIRPIRDLARENSEDALKTLLAVMRNTDAPPMARATAANSVLDRAYGKPTQHVEANVNFLDKLSDNEQRALLAALDAIATNDSGPEAGTEAAYH